MKNKKQQQQQKIHTGEISMEKSEIRNTGRTPNEGVVGSKIPMEFKVERLETNSGDVISREEMKEMDEETCDCDGNTERRRKRRKEKRRDWNLPLQLK